MFCLAGDAKFTVSSGNEHFTYHITKGKPTDQYPNPAWFISVLVGPNNSDDFAYMGMVKITPFRHDLDPMIKLTAKSRVDANTKSYKVAAWALRAIWQVARGTYSLPPGYTIIHSGHCGRCGAVLTHPASLDTGLGPGCAEQLGIEWAEHDRRSARLV